MRCVRGFAVIAVTAALGLTGAGGGLGRALSAPARAATLIPEAAANTFVLRHGPVEVDYRPGVVAGATALVYSDGGSVHLSFTAAEITTDQTGLGTLVSVPLRLTIDTGGERFGFFLPELDVAAGQSRGFRTVGVYWTFGGPDSFPRRIPSWTSIPLNGTARAA
jgi:hypothetical protein